jgi:integrase/recombinase XerC/integrase/recombinase XerD
MILQNAIDEFLIEQQIRGNSKKTLRYYRQSLGYFADFAGDISIAELNTAFCKQYYLHLTRKSITTTTIQTYIRALRAFLTYSFNEGNIKVNIPEKFRLPKAQKKVVDVLTDDEIQRIFACFDVHTLTGARNYAICALMLDSGLRLNEVVTLESGGVHITEGYAIVNGKGNKQRVVPLGLHTKRALIRYASKLPVCSVATHLDEKGQLIPLTAAAVASLFRRLKSRAKIPRLRPHLMRHTFATRYLQAGGDIYSLQQILGHASLEMVRRYVHLIPANLAVCHTQFSPLDNLMKSSKKP